MRILLLIGLLAIIVGGSVDIVLDAPTDWISFHVFFELLMIGGALVLTIALWLGWRRARAETHQLRAPLTAAIERQFQAWQLTGAEREIAQFLLKGYSHKQIAATTGRSERTVRQHAAMVYQKAGLSSRAELAGYFINHDIRAAKSPGSVSARG